MQTKIFMKIYEPTWKSFLWDFNKLLFRLLAVGGCQRECFLVINKPNVRNEAFEDPAVMREKCYNEIN